MCLPIRTVPISSPRARKRWRRPTGCNHNNLSYPPRATNTPITVSGALWNCQSAVKKADFISAFAYTQGFQFLALTETWITAQNSSTPAALSAAYHFSHTPRSTGKGGGTGLLTSLSWVSSIVTLPNLPISSFEYHAVAVSVPFYLTIIVLYRPPGSLGNFLEEIDMLVSSFPEDGTPLILLGDFNLPDPCQSTATVALLKSFDLTLTDTSPTHKAGSTLDLIFTRSCHTINTMVTPLHVSDHHLISLALPLVLNCNPPTPRHDISYRRNLRTLSPSTLSSDVLSALPTGESFSTLPPDAATATLLSALSSSFDKLCPPATKPARQRPPTPWLTDILRTERTKLRAAERKWKLTSLPSDMTLYHNLLATFSKSVTAAKSSFFHKKIEAASSDPRKLFSTLSSLLTPPPPPPPSSLSAGEFASFFERKVEDIRRSFPQPLPPPREATEPLPFTLSSFSALTDAETLKLITSGRPTTCPLDPIPSSLLQTISPDIIPFLTNTINSSLSSGVVPAALKQARVTPLLKKPSLDPTIVDNYRPVSLLSFLSKTLERAVSNQLSSYLLQNDLMDPNQSAFRTGHSTETALLAVTEALHLAKQKKLSSVLILLDLSAAFDTVNHRILLSSLSRMGVAGSALAWLTSYLHDRSYQVSWRGTLSDPQPLRTGVPQGSVLGPLLFSLYTRSLGNIIASHGLSYHCYADDTQLFLSFPPTDTQAPARISACLSAISAWMTTNHLKLNLGKTELLYLPAKHSPLTDLSITVENVIVTPSTAAKNLGVVLDDRLDFSSHIASTTRACRFFLNNVRRIRPFLSKRATQLLVQALVLSRLDYCNSLLAGLPACAIRPLQLVQNAAARLISCLPKSAHVTPLLVDLHWLPIAARIRFKALDLAFRAARGTAPSYLQSMVSNYTPTRPLRSASSGRLKATPLRAPGGSSARCRLFSVLVPRWWNELPIAVRTADTRPIFRRRLKTYLFKQYLV